MEPMDLRCVTTALAFFAASFMGAAPAAAGPASPKPDPAAPTGGGLECPGGLPTPEQCNCRDDDCDGVQDDMDENGTPLCPQNEACVASAYGCQCAFKCMDDPVACPAGQMCASVTKSDTGELFGNYCIDDPCPFNCFHTTVKSATGTALCAPAGTPSGDACAPIPVCLCKGASGCRAPCFGVTCGPGLACSSVGPNAGKCAEVNCFNFPCEACAEACAPSGLCVANPCTPTSCPGQTCKPSKDFQAAVCAPSCADVDCSESQICVEGVCVDDLCGQGDPCASGSYCDPATGACGPDLCSGVRCPGKQGCRDGECRWVDAGSACKSREDCSSGVCAAGVCCNVACEGACVSCDASWKEGGSTGICGPIPSGKDPGKACDTTHSWDCGTTGSCDGEGQCALYVNGTPCTGGGTCAAGRCEVATAAADRPAEGGCAIGPAGQERTQSSASFRVPLWAALLAFLKRRRRAARG